jgi:predicted ATP-dependent endonuclease of OLD family
LNDLEDLMLTSFFIKNFRLFNQFELKQLSRLNLFVGKNNSGKSALLEAIEIYANNASTTTLFELITNRQETWRGNLQTNGYTAGINPIRHLFLHHKLPNFGEEGITLGLLSSPSEQLHITIAAYRREIEEEDSRISRLVLIDSEDIQTDIQDLEIALVARDGDKLRRLFWLEIDLEREANRFSRNIALSGVSPKYSTVTVPTRNMTEEKLAALWDQINLTGLDEDVVSGLQLLEPSITGVAFVEGTDRTNRNRRIPLVKISNTTEPLPLKSLGDGIMRLFHIIVALVNARDGILLVDEFENGLHWSVQPKIWKTVFQLAERLNVQVFASTHSRDCIAGFEVAWQEQESLGAFFRLNVNQGGSVTATPYSCETLSDALETDVEIR